MIPLLVLASALLAQAAAPATHDFSTDYLVGSWTCQTQIGTGMGSGTVTYAARNGGTTLHQSGTIQMAGAGVMVNGTSTNRLFIDADITYEGPVAGYMWRNQYSTLSGRSLHTSTWWKKGMLQLDVVNGNGRGFVLQQINANEYTLNNQSLMGGVVNQTCTRRH